MSDVVSIERLDRRDFVIGAGAAGALVTLLSGAAFAQDKPAEPAWQGALQKILGGAKPTDARVNLDIAEIAENGNTVPFTTTIESPMTDADHVKALHVISTGNPQPTLATYRFSPAAGKAYVQGRIRLLQTQDVIAVAELSTGQFLMTRRNVKVTIGGCGG